MVAPTFADANITRVIAQSLLWCNLGQSGTDKKKCRYKKFETVIGTLQPVSLSPCCNYNFRETLPDRFRSTSATRNTSSNPLFLTSRSWPTMLLLSVTCLLIKLLPSEVFPTAKYWLRNLLDLLQHIWTFLLLHNCGTRQTLSWYFGNLSMNLVQA